MIDIAPLRQSMIAAVLSADADGWIHPPIPVCPTPNTAAEETRVILWRTADINRLFALRLVGDQRRRRDGLWSRKLTTAGLRLRKELRRSYRQSRAKPLAIPPSYDFKPMLNQAHADIRSVTGMPGVGA